MIKESISSIPPSIDKKFNKPTAGHRWRRFAARFKLVLYTLSEEVNTVPQVVHNFLSQLTIGQLRIPDEYLLPLEKKYISE